MEKIKQVHESEKKTNPIKFGYFNRNNNDREAAETLENLNENIIQTRNQALGRKKSWDMSRHNRLVQSSIKPSMISFGLTTQVSNVNFVNLPTKIN